MKNSPFIYGATVSRQSFTDRENEIRKLTDNLLGGINTMIISPRRWGKSSLVERVTKLIGAEHPKVKIATIDMFTVNSEEEFLGKLTPYVADYFKILNTLEAKENTAKHLKLNIPIKVID